MQTKPITPITFLKALVLAACPMMLVAQSTPSKPQLFYVHEDPVTEMKVAEYEKLSKDLVGQCQKFGISDSWATIQDDDHKYYTVTPITNMADLDKDSMLPLKEKLGKEAYEAMFAAFDKCYPSHRDYLITRMNDSYSYMPDGENEKMAEFPYRKYHYVYYEPQYRSQLSDLAKKLRDLNASKGARLHYNVYVSRFGNGENFIMAEEVAKDEADYKERLAYDNKLMGAEIDKIMADIKKLSRRMETKTGHVRTDLSYFATK